MPTESLRMISLFVRDARPFCAATRVWRPGTIDRSMRVCVCVYVCV
jgi:hypothetical protein